MKTVFYESGLKVYSCVAYYCLSFLLPMSPVTSGSIIVKSHWWVGGYLGVTSLILPPTSCPVCIAFPLVSQLRVKHLTAIISVISMGFQQVEEDIS